MTRVTDHFDEEEFLDSQTGELGASVLHLCEHLENLRSVCNDRPLRIVSGWRSVLTNALVGGVTASQHLYGRAADIPAGYATVDQALEAGFTGVGDLDGWAIHVDVRPGIPARWSY